jgi:hypothetical protein
MAVISTETFNPLNRFVNVRLQQGVPIVDADWNELDDIRKFEVRAFLKWFVGDGVPEGNDGFRIVGGGFANTFTISRGSSGAANVLSNVGRCLVDGLDVLIETDVGYTDQDLHQSKPGAATLATQLGVPVIPALAAGAAGTILVFLDVWERLITPSQRPTLIHPGLGTESCARIRREWAVRTRTGTALPVSGDADFRAGHSYYALATLTRRAGDPIVNDRDIADLRERRLLMPPATLVEDLFGATAGEYRRGQHRPAVSIKEAINALLRGDLPTTPDRAISPAAGQDVGRRAFLADGANGLVGFWTSNRNGGTDQILGTRLDLANIAGGFSSAATPITAGSSHGAASAALTPAGDLVVVYQTPSAGSPSIMLKRGTLATLAGAGEEAVTVAGGDTEQMPFVVVSGNLAVVFFNTPLAANRWSFRRRNLSTNLWQDPTPVTFAPGAQPDFHAAVDSTGTIWAAYRVGDDVKSASITPATATATVAPEDTHVGGADDREPFVLPLANGDVWLFWQSAVGIHSRRRDRSTSTWEAVQTIPGSLSGDTQPTAVVDADGTIMLLWIRTVAATSHLELARRNPVSGAWTTPRPLTALTNIDSSPYALFGPDGTTWVFWTRSQAGGVDLFFKRIVTAL